LNTAILCAALLFAKPLLRSILPRLFGSTVDPGSNSSTISRINPGFSHLDAEFGKHRQELTGKRVSMIREGNYFSMSVSESQEEIIELSETDVR